MAARRLSGFFDGVSVLLWYEPVSGMLQAQRNDTHAVVASDVRTPSAGALYVEGNDVMWPYVGTDLKVSKAAGHGGSLVLSVADNDEARSRALDFVLFVNSDSGAMSEVGPLDPRRVLRDRSRKLEKLASTLMTFTVIFGILAVVGGAVVAFVPVEDCSGLRCRDTYPNVGVGVALAVFGVFQAMFLYLVAGYIAVKNLETSIGASERN